VITLAELRYGIERMAAGNRRKRLDQWLRGELLLRFEVHNLTLVTRNASDFESTLESVVNPRTEG
jgi:predicted nucleic acid-binding protein